MLVLIEDVVVNTDDISHMVHHSATKGEIWVGKVRNYKNDLKTDPSSPFYYHTERLIDAGEIPKRPDEEDMNTYVFLYTKIFLKSHRDTHLIIRRKTPEIMETINKAIRGSHAHP